CPGNHSSRQSQAWRAAKQPAPGCRDRHHLRPQRTHRAGHPQPHHQTRGGVRCGGCGLCLVPLAPAFCAGRHHFSAAGNHGGVSGDALPGHQCQHHVPGRDCNRRGRHGRCGRGDDRERPQEAGGLAAQASRPPTGGGRALEGNHRSRRGGRPRAVLLAAHHHLVLRARLYAGSTGRSPVWTAG
ncbi:hypothetical protein KXW64_008390, partial [Aspergillus fumigatus]